MSSQMIPEVLNLQADQLNAGKPAAIEALVNATPAERAELAALMNLAARLKRALAPVLPSAAFRARLRDGLTLAAHHQATHRVLIAERDGSRRGAWQWSWLIGAAAIGSAAGVIAVLLRRRQSRKVGAPDAPSVTN